MATGDQTDYATRLRKLLPQGWFGDTGTTPFLDGVLAGIAYYHARGFAWVQFAASQLRLATANGEFLDMLASDFLGFSIARESGELDPAFRIRIRREILRPKATRAAIIAAVHDLTGNVPTVFEPRNASDTGGYGSLLVPNSGGGLGYAVAGGYGSLLLPFQAFLTVVRPPSTGIPAVSGYSSGASGYGSLATPAANVGATKYASLDDVRGVKDADIYAAIASVQPVATVIWTRIVDPAPAVGNRLGIDFILGRSTLG